MSAVRFIVGSMTSAISPARPAVRAWAPAFVALSAVWGSSFALIKVAVDGGVAPLWVSFSRCVLGAGTLWACWRLSAPRRASVPRDPRLWGHAAGAAVLMNSAPFTLIAWGETRISSVLAGVLIASTPLFTLLIGLVVLTDEPPSTTRLVGLAAGFVGVLVVIEVGRGVGPGHLPGTLAVIGAAACYGAGFVYTRRFLSDRPESGTLLSAVQITLAALELAVLMPFVGGVPSWPGSGAATAIVLLGSCGTGVAYILNFAVVRGAGPTVGATVTYAVPLWSTALGALLLDEKVGWNLLAGAALVVAGIALTRRPSAHRRVATPARVRVVVSRRSRRHGTGRRPGQGRSATMRR